MFVKDAMTRTSIKYFENDYINEIAKQVLKDNVKGGLVYNIKDELSGYFTEHSLLDGLVQEKVMLSEILKKEIVYLDEHQELRKVNFSDHELMPVRNKYKRITGFLTKEQYLSSYLKVTQVELSQMDAIFNSAHNGILSIDKDGTITSINPAAEEMALTTKEKAIGKFLTDVVTNGGLLRVVRTGEGHSEKYKVGNRIYISHRTPIFDGDNLAGAVGVFQDISEINFMAGELEAVKGILKEQETILNHSSDGICVTDVNANMIKSNQRFQEMFSEVQGSNQLPAVVKDLVVLVSETGEQQNVLETNKSDRKPLILSAMPIKNSQEKLERIVVNVKDVTELEALRCELNHTKPDSGNVQLSENSNHFIANSAEMTKLIETVSQVAKVDVTVLLNGESGVGKEEVAKLIQQSSPRSEKPFIKVNCGAIPESLIESELFGYEGGAFTGALKGGKAGLFEQANNGTLFLDEIGEVPLQLQVKLLRVLQEMEITRVGGTRPINIDVRIIAATNRNLQELVMEGTFREDLFYRLNVIPVSIPPLRKRVEDIPLLIESYSKIFSAKYQKHLHFSKSAIKALVEYKWPGNVRELVNIMERIYVTSIGSEIQKEGVLNILGKKLDYQSNSNKAVVVNEVLPLKAAIDELERELIYKASLTERSYRGIARLLEVNPSTIVRKVKKLGGDL